MRACIYMAMCMYGHVWLYIYEFLNFCLQSPGQLNTMTFNQSQVVLEMVSITKVCTESVYSVNQWYLCISTASPSTL